MERFITRILGKYFEAFFKDFKKEDFHFDTFKGQTKLENLEMNESVLQELIGIPQLLVKSCKIDSIELNMSPTKLSSTPVRVTIDRIEMVLREPEHILPLPMVLAALLGESESEKEADKKDEQEAGEFGLAQKIADGIHVDIGFIGVTLQSLGEYKTEKYGEWTPPTGRLEIQGIHVRQTDAEWQHVTDLRAARKSGTTPDGDCYSYREVDIASIKFTLTPYADEHIPAHKRSVRLLDGLPVKIRMTTKRPKDSAVVLGLQTDVMIARLPIIATPLHLSYVMDNLKGIGETFARQACEGPPFIVEVKVVQARGIAAADRGNTSDPYAKITVDKRFFKTETKKKTLTPHWDETFKWRVVSYPKKEIKIEVHDWDRMSKDDLLGSGSIVLESIEGLTEGGSACEVWVPLNTQGEVLLAINIIDPATLIEPGPLTFLNVFVDELDIRIYEEDNDELMSRTGRRSSIGAAQFTNVKGIGIEVHDFALHVIKHPIAVGDTQVKQTIQTSIQDIRISLLDINRIGDDAFIVHRPKEVQGNLTAGKEIEFAPATLAMVAACDMARASGQPMPSMASTRLSVAEVMRTSARGRAPSITDSHTPAKRREAASALGPPLVRLKMTTVTPQPLAPELALELEAVIMPLKITADVSLIPRFTKLAQIVQGECNDVKPPPDILADIAREHALVEEKTRHLKEQKRAEKALQPIRPPPALGLHIQVLALVLDIPNPARYTQEGMDSSIYIQARDTLISSASDTEAPEFLPGLLTLPGDVFPSSPADRTINTDSWRQRPQVGPRLQLSVPLISVSTRASARASLQRMVTIRDIGASAEVAMIRLIKTLNPADEMPTAPEHIPEGFPLAIVSGDIKAIDLSMNQSQYTQLMAFQAAMMESLAELQPAPGSDGEVVPQTPGVALAKPTGGDDDDDDDNGGNLNDWRKEITATPQQRLKAVKMQQLLSLLPALIAFRIDAVTIALSQFDTSSGKLQPLSTTTLSLVEFVTDNQAEMGSVKLAWKELSVASSATTDAHMHPFLRTLGDHRNHNFFSVRVERSYPSADLLTRALSSLEQAVKDDEDKQAAENNKADTNNTSAGTDTGALERKPSRAPPAPPGAAEAAALLSAQAAEDSDLHALLENDDIGEITIRLGGIGLDGGVVRTAALLNKVLQTQFLVPGSHAAHAASPGRHSVISDAGAVVTPTSGTAPSPAYLTAAAAEAGATTPVPAVNPTPAPLSHRRKFRVDYEDKVELEALQTIEGKLMEAWEMVLAAKAACADLTPHSGADAVTSSGSGGSANLTAASSTAALPPRLVARSGKKEKEVTWRDVSADPIIFAGYLSMRDGIMKKWRSMWFILQFDALLCFKHEEDLCPTSILTIDATTTVTAVTEEKGKKVPAHSFNVTGSKGDYWVLAAADQGVETQWHQNINAHIADLKGGKSKPPSLLTATGAASASGAGAAAVAAQALSAQAVSVSGKPLSRNQIDRFSNQLQLTEQALTSAMSDGEQLFARIPRLYEQAVDIRVKELQESLRERDQELKRLHTELSSRDGVIRKLEGKVADARREASLGTRNPEMKRRLVRLRELRTAATRAERRQHILEKPVSVIHHEDAGSKESLRHLHVKFKKKEGFKIGIGETDKPKPHHWYDLKHVTLVSYPTVARLGQNKGQPHLAFKIVIEDKKHKKHQAVTWVLQALTDEALKVWVLGLQELLHEQVAGPEPLSEGRLLTRKVLLRLKQTAEREGQGTSKVVAQAVKVMLQHKWAKLREELGTDNMNPR